jgi:hypothetical protein
MRRIVGGMIAPRQAGEPNPRLLDMLGELTEGQSCCHCGTVIRQVYGGATWVWLNLEIEACCPPVARALGLG